MNHYLFLLPEIVLFLLSCLVLFFGKRDILALITVLITLGVTAFSCTDASPEILNGMLYISPFSQTVKLTILIISCVFLAQIIAVKQSYSKYFPVLVLFSLLGMLLSVSSKNLMALYLAIELQSIGLYVLASVNQKSIKSAEAGVKYVLLGTFMSAVMIYGISLIFVSSGTLAMDALFVQSSSTHLIGILLFTAGLLFKIGATPFHAWVGDIYEGSPTLSSTFFAVLPKISIVAVLISIASYIDPHTLIEAHQSVAQTESSLYMRNILFLSGILSLLFGTFAAFGQSDIKRFLGFASVSHVGYALLGIGASTSFSVTNPGFIYILIYSLTNLGIFSVVLMLKDKVIISLSTLNSTNKFIAFTFVVLLLSLAGIPPFTGFFAKVYVIKNLVDSGYIVSSLIAVFTGIISAFYYLRITKEVYLTRGYQSSGETKIKISKVLIFIAAASGLFSMFGFVLLL
ncbi:NADH-Ubiquinone/plastoquinone (complex I), various chains family protein [Neorickettsia helminthoeca str. Oregon]|uniref:NADH-quinone oxidoreductase subunit N n=1 Tax=Neorickettsia helminthoeca str. Oregon TaxID=1286528 RepID=X5HMB1_9RICK|nr:NADH-quinone oxidoreductase subunit N [Neorickettsia helminthoeca]AHX11590.1 NADH-Ubiquinone/plastoquinone (complex I), various chains family protein [Neorickettsia helminthoeca str. Oregon]